MNKNVKRFGVIMAGGEGTRFWPLSRQRTPKQLLNLSGKDLMINESIDRLATVVPKDNIFIVTSALQAPDMLIATSDRVLPEHILAEPAARNTAACIGYAAMEIIKKHGDGIMLITPSDHFIQDLDKLTETFSLAIKVANQTDKLVTIGITPTFPSVGFGYIKYQSGNGSAKAVVEFKEKPDIVTAQHYINSGDYVWNSGMFIWKASVILAKFEQYVPDIYNALKQIGDAMGTKNELNTLNKIYPNIQKISIDYAIMEPAASNGEVLTIPSDFGWNDVGSWDMMTVLHETDENENIVIGDGLAINSKNSIVYSSSKLVAAVGLENIVIVETPDAIMVCDKKNAQDVKLIVERLKEAKRNDLL